LANGLASEPAEKKAPDVARLKRMYGESQSLTSEARLESQKDDDRYHGYQLTRAQKGVLKRRRQPDNTWNYTRLAINGTLGVIKQGATDPRAYPKNPKDEDSADVASKTLRYIADYSRFDSLKLDVAYDILVPGTGAAIIEADEDNRVVVTQIRHEEFFYDPHARRADFSDARFMGIAKWQWADDLKAEYPDSKTDIEAAMDGNGFGLAFDATTEDRPSDASRSVAWVDKTQKRIMVVEIYHREADGWQRCKFHSGGVLDYGASPYLDDKKKPCCPIEAESCYVDRENNRAGLVRDMRGPQDEINKRSSKLLHELNTRQIQEASPGSGMGSAEAARKEAARPDGVIPSGWQVVPRQDVVSGQERLLQFAVQAMSRFSPNPAVLGREGENQSGRSNLIRQQAGMTEQAITFGSVEEWELRVYRQMWNRARQFMTAADFIRATDDEGSPEFIGINQPPSLKGPDGEPVTGPDGQPVRGQPMPDKSQPGEPLPDGKVKFPQLMENGKPAFLMPDGSKALGYENALAELDVDIDIDTVPDVANVMQEQFDGLVKLAERYPQDVTFDDLLEVSTLPGKRKLLEKRKARKEDAAKNQGGQQQMAQQAMGLELADKAADVQEKQANTALIRAKTATEEHKPFLDAAKLEHEKNSHRADTGFRAAEMDQADNQFAGQQEQQERLAAQKAAQSPPPGQ
jgi:hypothetical protein